MDLSTSSLTTLAWEDHQPHLSTVFARLQLQASLVDVNLTCSTGQTIKCHKVLLAAASPYFQQLFSENSAKVCPVKLGVALTNVFHSSTLW